MEVDASGQVVHQASTTFLNGTKIARSGSLLMTNYSWLKPRLELSDFKEERKKKKKEERYILLFLCALRSFK